MKTIVLKGTVIDGTGRDPVENGIVVITENKITYAGASVDAPLPENSETIEITNGFILPGLIDCHTHLCSLGTDTLMSYIKPNYELLLGAVRDCSRLIDAGFTSVREIGMFGPHLKKGIEKGLIRGPRLTVSGRMLSITSGHGDLHPFDIDFSNRENPIAVLVDGPDECMKGARTRFREGAQFIKICSTGGVMSEGDSCEDSQFSPEELNTIVQEADRHNAYVATHAHGTRGIRDALKAGARSIEHGMYLDEHCVELMAKKDAFLVPTLSVLKLICKNPENIPSYAYEKGIRGIEAHQSSVQLARRAGIKIALGSDFLGGDSELLAYGKNGIEFKTLVEAGLTPMEAIVAGTKTASYLTLSDKETGTLEKDKLADVIIVEGDPIKQVELLSNPDKIKVVIKDGRIEKDIRLHH